MKGGLVPENARSFEVGANGMETKVFSGQAAADNVKRGQWAGKKRVSSVFRE
jgi:hypothetical protein